jgi:hypothetical protein
VRPRHTAISLAVALLAALLPEAAFAVAGQVTHVSGAVIARRTDGGARILSLRSEVNEGDLVITSDNTYVRIKFTDGGDLVLRPNTQLKIDAYSYQESSPSRDSFAMSLLKGGLRSVTGLLGKRNPNQFKLNTATATVGIRGTHLGALVCNNDCGGVLAPGGRPPANGLHVDVADGVIVVTTRAGSTEFRVGDYGHVPSANALPVLVPQNQGARVNVPLQMTSTSEQRSPGTSGGGVGKSQAVDCEVR